MSGVYGLVVAAGRGTRAGGGLPKQYRPLGGKPVLRHTLEALLGSGLLDGVQVVIHPDDVELYEAATQGMLLNPVVFGADTRAGSVRKGLDALRDIAPEVIMIHDAARPFISANVIEGLLEGLKSHDGACPALPVVDALWEGDETLDRPRPRAGLWRAQTPQAFRYEAIFAAQATASADALDDVEIARAAGLTVARTVGDEANFKITTPADFTRAERELERMS